MAGLYVVVDWSGINRGSLVICCVRPQRRLRSRAAPGSIPARPQFAYVSNQGDGKISEFSVDSKTGKLSLIGTAAAGSSGLKGLAATPSTRLVFAANPVDSKIFAFKFSSKGKTPGVLKPLRLRAPVLALHQPHWPST